MRTITLLNPEKIVFGHEALNTFTSDIQRSGFKKLYVITISFMVDQLTELFDALNESGIEYKIDTTIINEPSFAEFEHILECAKQFEADSIVGIGGGSVMDVCKLVAAQLKSSQPLEETIGIGNLKERNTYVACIPTTSGTGSEVSPNAIFVDAEGQKKGIISPYLVPDATYVCPKLTISVPPAVTAATGIDALTHCLEAYANKFAHPVIDMIALEGIKLIADNLLEAYTSGDNLDARSNVALGSMYGGMCLGPVNTGAVHALAYPLGTEFHMAHGLSNAILLPYVMEFNLPEAIPQYASIAEAIGAKKGSTPLETAKNGIEKIRELNKACKIPSRLSDENIPSEAIEGLAKNALQVQRLLNNNLRHISLTDAIEIYKAAY